MTTDTPTIQIERTNYQGWPNCYRLSNGIVELIATTDVGPRIIHFGFEGGENEFATFKDDLGRAGDETWRIYGGHRLWRAPEAPDLTYVPDNDSVDAEKLPSGIRLTQTTEAASGLQKEIELTLSPNTSNVKVVHRIRNRGNETVTLSLWALSVMSPGGRAILPLPPEGHREGDYRPSRSTTTWSYTNLKDPRWTIGDRYIFLDQDPARESAQKLGALVTEGWLAYCRNGKLFLKSVSHDDDAIYPDYGSNAELFANAEILELETLGPLQTLEPGQAAEHHETWHLAKCVELPKTEAEADEILSPHLKKLST